MSKQPSAHPVPEEDRSDNFAARLGHSASSLARSVISDAPPSTFVPELAGSAANAEKAQPSSSASGAGPSSTWSQNQATRRNRSSGSSETIQQVGFREATGLRSSLTAGGDMRDEMDTFYNGASADKIESGLSTGRPISRFERLMAEAYGDGVPAAREAGRTTWPVQFRRETDHLQYRLPDYPTPARRNGFNDFSAAEERDGADVVALLRDPSIMADPSALETELNDALDVSANDLFGERLTEDERRVADRFRSNLPAPPPKRAVSPSNPLNLHPNPDIFNASDSRRATMFSSHTTSDQYDLLPSSTSRNALDAWMEAWDGVLRSYTDEVWGDALPYVRQAQQEIKHLKSSGTNGADGTALKRLRMILGHIKLPSNA